MNMTKEQFNKKQFRTAIRALYKINEKPEEKGRRCADFTTSMKWMRSRFIRGTGS